MRTARTATSPIFNVTAVDPGRLAAGMNFARDVVEAAPPDRSALLELARDGGRREWTFGEVADRSARLAGTLSARHGVGRGDVVMTLIGNRPEWVLTMVACFRIGAVALACNEQLRATDLRAADRKAAAQADRRRRAEPLRAVGRRPRVPGPARSPTTALFDGPPTRRRPPSSSRPTRA